MRWKELLSRKQEVVNRVNKDLSRLKLVDISHLDINSSVVAGLHSIPGQMVIRSGNIRGIASGSIEYDFSDRVRQKVNTVYKQEVMNGELVSDQGKGILGWRENSPGFEVVPQGVNSRWLTGIVYTIAIGITQTDQHHNST